MLYHTLRTAHPNGTKNKLKISGPHKLLVSEGCKNLITYTPWPEWHQNMFVIHNSPELALVTFLLTDTYYRDTSGTVPSMLSEVFDSKLCNLNGIRRCLVPARRYLNCHESAVQTESLPCGSPLLRPVRISSTWSHAEACELPHTILTPAWHRSSICLPPLLCPRHMACISHISSSSSTSSSWILNVSNDQNFNIMYGCTYRSSTVMKQNQTRFHETCM